ncbi:hypothetical protein GJV26_09660 [Massilia dura]|uniref:DUF4279 domain-containing protein n=1 Tax=Pseudoduganella dura TaxID=321982 RepID=A0A6I3XAK1_9BURK|nr:hypothetical protein [Pseudoduganella dura]MUI12736.1 hypothetical protein [Pseudoduganella dura]GGY17677.1 hypothetical protein GCM10007386_54150 [Pseudoduganella dura]
MNKASLKVYGDEAAVADARDGLPSEPEYSWKKGDVRPDGRVRIDAGFYVDLGQDEDPVTLLRQLRAWLHECEARNITFDVPPLAAELHIAMTHVGPEDALDFSIADLTLLVDMGITLSITG